MKHVFNLRSGLFLICVLFGLNSISGNDNVLPVIAFELEHESVNHLEFSPSGQSLVSSSEIDGIKTWSTRHSRIRHRIGDEGERFSAPARINKDSAYMVAGTRDGLVKVFGLRDGKLLATSEKHGVFVTHASFANDGSHILSVSQPVITQWLLGPQANSHVVKLGKSLSFTEEKMNIVKKMRKGNRVLLGTSSGRVQSFLPFVVGPSTDFRFPEAVTNIEPAEKSYLVITLNENKVVVRKNASLKATLTPLKSKIKNAIPIKYGSPVTVSSDGKHFAVINDDFNIVMRRVDNQEVVANFCGHQDTVLSVAINSKAQYMVSSSADGYLKLWSLADGQLVRDLHVGKNHVKAVSISASGDMIAAVVSPQKIKIFYLPTEELAQMATEASRFIALNVSEFEKEREKTPRNFEGYTAWACGPKERPERVRCIDYEQAHFKRLSEASQRYLNFLIPGRVSHDQQPDID